MTASIPAARRWLALAVVCLGVVMVVLDATIVNVALPSIRADLGFTEATLVWVFNAYLLTCGGFLLLGGRLGDLYGHRRVFMVGIVLFTGASAACGFANAQVTLVVARAVQGIGGAIVDAVALALLMQLFVEERERAKAMGVYSFVCAGGGSIGVLLGGILTDAYDWHWVFLVNVPIGAAVLGLSVALLPKADASRQRVALDVAARSPSPSRSCSRSTRSSAATRPAGRRRAHSACSRHRPCCSRSSSRSKRASPRR
jgi:MFS family permease